MPQVIEKMERETGFEPATSSLGNGTSFENKEHSVFAGLFLAIEDAQVFILNIGRTPNGVQTVFTADELCQPPQQAPIGALRAGMICKAQPDRLYARPPDRRISLGTPTVKQTVV